MTHSMQTDLEWLDGAEVVRIERGEVGLKLWFQLPEPVTLAPGDRDVSVVALEVWQDEEGNGPGHLAMVGYELSGR